MQSGTGFAFPDTIKVLAAKLRECDIDHAAFELPLPVCELTKCRATCCHDGVVLSAEEIRVLDLPPEQLNILPDGRQKTATVAAQAHELASDFPPHFPKTRCIFLDENHFCRWQLNSVAEARHPWFYKPISCWMHPLLLVDDSGRPRLTLIRREDDEKKFASYTGCGRPEAEAPPARESLTMELEMLASISGRDFYGELNAPPGFLP